MTFVGRIKQTVLMPELRSQFAVVFDLQSARWHQVGLCCYGMKLRPWSGLR